MLFFSSKSGLPVDVESLKSLVETNNIKIKPEEKRGMKGSVKLLHTEKRKRGSSFRQVMLRFYYF